MPEVKNLLAIDPGSTQSAWLVYSREKAAPVRFGIEVNEEMYAIIRDARDDCSDFYVEMIASYGMAVGREVFETVFWIGRFFELAAFHGLGPQRLYRKDVKLHLCQDSRAKDGNVRQSLLDRYGPGKQLAVGTKKAPGPLYGVSKDVWAALAIAVTAADKRMEVPF